MSARTTTTCIALTAMVTGSLLGSGAVLAQEVGEIETITVTARKRAESLQEIPLSITAFTEDQIAEEGIANIDDIAARTPGFSFHTSFGRQDFDRPTIRGQSNILGDPNASFFIDGVYVNGSITTSTMNSVERVEVIKGPQAALFGRATFAGAVNFVTKTPGNEFEGDASVTAAQDGDYRGAISVSGPIIEDKLAFFLAASSDTFDGNYSAPMSDGSTRDVGGEKTDSYDGVLYATPTDNLTIKLRASRSRSDDDMYVQALQDSTKNNFSLLDPVTNPYSPGYYKGVIDTAPTTFPSSCLEIEQISATDGDPVSCGVNTEIRRAHLSAEYNLRDWTLTGSAAYSHYDNAVVVDGDYNWAFGLGGFLQLDFGSRIDDTAYEFRIASPTDSRYRVQVGVYDYQEDEDDLRIRAFTSFGVVPVPAADVEDVENRAYFASVEVDITDRVTGSLEGRYARDERTLNEGRPITIGAGTPEAFDVSVSESFYSFTPRATLDWEMTDNANTYVYVAKGNKPGGFNKEIYRPLVTADEFLRWQAAGELAVEEEEAWTYEIGAKTNWLDNRLILNVAAYYIDWSNQGLTSSRLIEETDGSPYPGSAVLNIGKSEVKGLEFEAVWQATDQLTVSGTLAYTDATIEEFTDLTQAILFDFADGTIDYNPAFTQPQLDAFVAREGNVAGNTLPAVSEWQYSFSTAWDDQLGSTAWDWFARADYQFESSRYAQIHNLAETGINRNLNLRAGVKNGTYTLTAWITNATDDDTATGVTRGRDFLATQRTATGERQRGFTYSLPRERQFGVTAAIKF
ncbi:MAG: TonB-dependent receptor [Chromatiales bacterium]|nr:TonB-dependent receptor [Chromatiales bacterium]